MINYLNSNVTGQWNGISFRVIFLPVNDLSRCVFDEALIPQFGEHIIDVSVAYAAEPPFDLMPPLILLYITEGPVVGWLDIFMHYN